MSLANHGAWKGLIPMPTVTGVVADICSPSASSRRLYVTPAEGHIYKACRSKYKRKREQPNQPSRDQAATTNVVCNEVEEDIYTMFQLTNSRDDPLYITVSVNQVPVKMEIDTGATLTVISESNYRQAWTKEQATPLQTTKTKLRTYTDQEIPVKGSLQVMVIHGNQQKVLPLIVTEGQGPSLLGRKWLGELKLDWKAMYRVQGPDPLSAIMDAHEPVF